MDRFLAERGFDTIADYRSIECDQPVFVASTREWQNLDATTDACARRRAAGLGARGGRPPSLPCGGTGQTHFPYFTASSKQHDGGGEASIGRYLAALREGDHAMPHLPGWTQADGAARLDADRRGGRSWGGFRAARDDNAHQLFSTTRSRCTFSLMLMNARLFHGEVDSTVGGLIDLAPTLADLAGLPAAPTWQGRSLF